MPILGLIPSSGKMCLGTCNLDKTIWKNAVGKTLLEEFGSEKTHSALS